MGFVQVARVLVFDSGPFMRLGRWCREGKRESCRVCSSSDDGLGLLSGLYVRQTHHSHSQHHGGVAWTTARPPPLVYLIALTYGQNVLSCKTTMVVQSGDTYYWLVESMRDGLAIVFEIGATKPCSSCCESLATVLCALCEVLYGSERCCCSDGQLTYIGK